MLHAPPPRQVLQRRLSQNNPHQREYLQHQSGKPRRENGQAPSQPTPHLQLSPKPKDTAESTKSRSRSKDDKAAVAASSSTTAPEPADTPAPKRKETKAPEEPFKARASINYIAANLLEAVKIDGFDVEDAVRALTLERARKGASDKENKAIDKEMKNIYDDNWEAIEAFNQREAADKKNQGQKKDNKKQRT